MDVSAISDRLSAHEFVSPVVSSQCVTYVTMFRKPVMPIDFLLINVLHCDI